MPETTPQIKVEKDTKFWSGSGAIWTKGYDQAKSKGIWKLQRKGNGVLHPYENPAVVTGQATVGLGDFSPLPGRRGRIFPNRRRWIGCGASSYLTGIFAAFPTTHPRGRRQSEEFPI